jgi:CheY-like chemotaxis protein
MCRSIPRLARAPDYLFAVRISPRGDAQVYFQCGDRIQNRGVLCALRRILIVDNDAQVRKLYAQQALARQDEVVEISDGIEAIALCQEHRFDIILLAAELPELDGFHTLKVLKRLCSTPVIMISERDDKEDRIRGLETGRTII